MPFRRDYEGELLKEQLEYEKQWDEDAKAFEEEHFLVIPNKTCETCRKSKKLNKENWHVDSGNADGFKNTCKTCRNKLPIDYAVDRKRLESDPLKVTVSEVTDQTKQLLFNTRKNKVPHLAELYEHLVTEFDGADGIARKYRDTYDEAMPGGAVRKGILDRIVSTGDKVTEMGNATVPLDMIENQDLQKLALDQIKKLTQAGQINQTFVQSLFKDDTDDVDTGTDPMEDDSID